MDAILGCCLQKMAKFQNVEYYGSAVPYAIELIEVCKYNEEKRVESVLQMSQRNVHIFSKFDHFDYLILLPILALAFYLAFIPHDNYPYPVHIDEWMHLAHCKSLVAAGEVIYPLPFSGEEMTGLIGSDLGLGPHLELGFYIFWGTFHQISGISWLTIFKYFPGIIFVITVLSVYVLARREGFGWEAAFFTCLIPTTVGILGPGFLIPVAMGLLFIPLSLFLAFNFRNRWSYLALVLFTCFLLMIHAATAVLLVIMLIPCILLNIKGNFKHSLGITLSLAISFLVPFPWIFNMLLPIAKTLFISQPLLTYVDLPRIINTYGYIPILFCLLGTLLLAIKRGKVDYSLVLGLLALLLMLVAFFTFHYGLAILYYRGLIAMMLIIGIVAGAGLMGVRNLRLPAKFRTWLKVPFITENVGRVLCLIFIGLILAITIPSHLNIPYYHMIDEQDYQAFVWIRENVDDKYDRAILDPWKATAFTAITERSIYTRLHSYPKPIDGEAYRFIKEGCRDTALLRESGVSIVYTREECHNPDLIEVRKNVYLLMEDKAVE